MALESSGHVERLIIQSLYDNGESKAVTRNTEQLFNAYRCQNGKLGNSGKVTVRKALNRLQERELVRKVHERGTNRPFATWQLSHDGVSEAEDIETAYDDELSKLQRRFGVLTGGTHSAVFDSFEDIDIPINWSVEPRQARIRFQYESPYVNDEIPRRRFNEHFVVGYDSQDLEYEIVTRTVSAAGDKMPTSVEAVDTIKSVINEIEERVEENILEETIGEIDGIGEVITENLKERYGSLSEIRRVKDSELREINGISDSKIKEIRNVSGEPKCAECENKLMFNDDSSEYFCPFCSDSKS